MPSSTRIWSPNSEASASRTPSLCASPVTSNGDPDDVLELSALVGVRYKPMDTEGKDIAHSNMITVLDRQGRIYYQMKGFDERLQPVVEAIEIAAGATL